MERMGWTYEELAATPADVVFDMWEMWRAQAEARRLKENRGGS